MNKFLPKFFIRQSHPFERRCVTPAEHSVPSTLNHFPRRTDGWPGLGRRPLHCLSLAPLLPIRGILPLLVPSSDQTNTHFPIVFIKQQISWLHFLENAVPKFADGSVFMIPFTLICSFRFLVRWDGSGGNAPLRSSQGVCRHRPVCSCYPKRWGVSVGSGCSRSASGGGPGSARSAFGSVAQGTTADFLFWHLDKETIGSLLYCKDKDRDYYIISKVLEKYFLRLMLWFLG